MTPKDLDALLKVLRKHGVSSISTDGLGIHLYESAPTKPSKADLPEAKEEAPSEDYLIDWSSKAPF